MRWLKMFYRGLPSREEVLRMSAREYIRYYARYQLPIVCLGAVAGSLIARFVIIPLL